MQQRPRVTRLRKAQAFSGMMLHQGAAVIVPLLLSVAAAAQTSSMPANLDSHLQQLLKERQAVGAEAASREPGMPVTDSQDRVRVRVLLTGAQSARDIAKKLTDKGSSVDPFTGDAERQLIASVPVSQLTAAATLPGVQAVLVYYSPRLAPPVPRPGARPTAMAVTRALQSFTGQSPSQASGPIGVNGLNGRYDGTGQVIAIISDTYNVCTTCSKREADDIASNNLPGAGNPAGNTTPVVVVAEGTSSFSDEGRAMMQLAYGIAPKAKFCFATGFSNFSANVAALYKPVAAGGLCGATVIIDDVGFGDSESFFGDGTSPSRAVMGAVAAGVTYLSSAGNARGLYDGTWNGIADSVVRGGTFGNLNFANVPAAATAGGFQNFSTTGGQQISFSITTQSAIDFVMQWNDPYNPAGITSDYNLLVFDASGNYLPALSSTNTNTATGIPAETVTTPRSQSATTYQIVISAATPPGTAQRLRIIPSKDADQYTSQGLPATTTEVPAIYGHPAAPGVIGTAAYSYQTLTSPEIYSSGGPFYNYFDSTGARLTTPEVRQQPLLAGFDDVDTTYFGSDSDNDGFPNFAGTSAAAPTAGGVAALILQASGGTATPAQIATYLQGSATHANLWSPKDGYGYINAQRAADAVNGTTGIQSTTVLTASANPAPPNTPLILTATVTSRSAVRSGQVDFFDGNKRLGGVTLSGNVATLTLPSFKPGDHKLSANYGGDDDDMQSEGTLDEDVSNIDPTLLWPHPASVPYGTNLVSVLTASAQDDSDAPILPVDGTYAYFSGTTAITPATVLPTGTYTLTANFTPADTSTYNKTSKTISFSVTQGVASIAVASNSSNVYPQSPVTISTMVASSSGTPTGSVAFFDGTTSLGSVPLTNGAAAFSTTSLALGSHSITAVYSGDTNFATQTSAVASVQVSDFSLALASGTNTQTVSRGTTATYNFAVTLSGSTTLPSAVNLTLTGLPTGATYTFSPATIAAGTGTTNVTLTITVPQQLALLHQADTLMPLSLALLLMPIGLRARNRTTRASLLSTTLLLAGGTGFLLMTGCGGSNSQSNVPHSYNLTVTGTSASVAHTAIVNLTVQ